MTPADDPAPGPSGPTALDTTADPWADLRRHTPARIALGRVGLSLPTSEVLKMAQAHAHARDAVHQPLDVPALAGDLEAAGWRVITVASRAGSRDVYLRRPDLGRQLDDAGAATLAAAAADIGPVDLALVVADGLSALAVQRHVPPLLQALRSALGGGVRCSPVVVAGQGRVALGDAIGAALGARAVLVLLGERPGSSSPDSLGAYLTHAPRPGCTDAQRNCVSNIRPEGLPPAVAAHRLAWLVGEALRRGLSGVALKDDSSGFVLTGDRDATPLPAPRG